MAYGEIREWAERLPVAALFTLDEVQEAFPCKSRAAIKMALGRLCGGDDPLVARAVRSIYCRRRLGQRRQAPIPVEAREALPWLIAGPGSGLTGPDLINQIGWSTQVPPSRWIAVVGRPPQAPDSATKYEGRSNEKRLALNRWEVSLIEAARCFDAWAEVGWEEAMEKYGDNKARGFYSAPVRIALFLDAASSERGLGPLFQGRCRDLGEVASTEGPAIAA
ncbi:hypothetical protein [Candidatus Poriferisocius sp.]|uniref:hypothetical protein n=1 Tax=Candidatus Poriferisocius sp. TaxID=3101276 RepID=UPI003B021B51